VTRFRNVASCSGGSNASNSAGETFSDSDNIDLDRITVRRTGVFVSGQIEAPAIASAVLKPCPVVLGRMGRVCGSGLARGPLGAPGER
jgi:hypothetical protein